VKWVAANDEVDVGAADVDEDVEALDPHAARTTAPISEPDSTLPRRTVPYFFNFHLSNSAKRTSNA
jgi:hypothetical protein